MAEDYERFMYNDRLSKTAILREVMDKNPDLVREKNWVKVVYIAGLVLDKIPTNIRKGAKLTRQDLGNIVYAKRERRSQSFRPVAQVIKPVAKDYGYNELLTASKLLNVCGGSLARAQEVLGVVININGNKESS